MRTPAHTQEEYRIVSDAIVEILSDGVSRSPRWLSRSLEQKGIIVNNATITQSCKRDSRIEEKNRCFRGIEWGLVRE